MFCQKKEKDSCGKFDKKLEIQGNLQEHLHLSAGVHSERAVSKLVFLKVWF